MDKFNTCEEVAKLYKVKVSTVWEWIRAGKLDAIRIGKQYRISKDSLEKFERQVISYE